MAKIEWTKKDGYYDEPLEWWEAEAGELKAFVQKGEDFQFPWDWVVWRSNKISLGGKESSIHRAFKAAENILEPQTKEDNKHI